MSESESEKPEIHSDYYKEAVKLFYFNCILYNHLEKVLAERNDLRTKVLKFELLGGELAQLDDDEIMNQLEERKKKSRRSAADIDRQFFCNFPNCKKAYGTEASLTQHVRLKHGQNSGTSNFNEQGWMPISEFDQFIKLTVMNKVFSRKHSDNSLVKQKPRSPMNAKENNIKFKYPEVMRRKESTKPLQVQTNNSDIRSPSAQSTQSPINKSILITHRSQSMFQDAQYIDYIITNREVNAFLKKHFLHEHMHTNSSTSRNTTKLICDSWERVPVTYFIKALFNEYPEIIEDHHLNEKLNIKLKTLIKDLISDDGQMLSLNKLQIHTRHLGLLGLLLTALRDIQDAPTVAHPTPKNQSISHENDVIQQQLSKQAQDLIQSTEKEVNEMVNSKLSVFTNKQKEIEKQLQQLKQKAMENFDLFQHEARNKTIIQNLKLELQQKDKIIAELEQKLMKMSSSEETHCPKASPIRMQSPSQSPFCDSSQQQQRLIVNLMNSWDMGSMNEDYRFAQILTAQENNQMPFQHFQLIPIIKTMPGFGDFVGKCQMSMHIITNFVQNCMTNENNAMIDLYTEIITLFPNLKVSDQDAYLMHYMQLFLKSTVCMLQVKSTFQVNKLKEWLLIKRQLTEQQNQFLKNLVNKLIEITQYTFKQIPQSKAWQQQTAYHDFSHQDNRLIENQIINAVIRKQLNQLLNKQNTKLCIVLRILQCFYNSDVEELIGLMQSIQGETEIDIFLSKVLLDSDCINLILFPSMINPKYILKSLQNLLQFKCPGQFYMQFTKQVCQNRNIELLTELLTKQQMNCEIAIRIWDVLGAIAKSTSLRECKENLLFVIRREFFKIYNKFKRIQLSQSDFYSNILMSILNQHQAQFPHLLEVIDYLRIYHEAKLWKQLSDQLLIYIKDPQLNQGTHLRDLFEGFVKRFYSEIDEMKLVRFLIKAADQYGDYQSRIDFLSQFKLDEQPQLVINILVANFMLQQGKLQEVDELLRKYKKNCERLQEVDPLVYSMLYYLAYNFYKIKQNYQEFYVNALQYLAYTSDAEMLQEQKVQLSYEMALAVLVSPNIYNFSELLQQPVLVSLKESQQHNWIYHLLEIFNRGSVAEFLTFQFNENGNALAPELQMLNEKIRIMAILELAFSLPKNDRVCSFNDLARAADLKIDEVESLVMRTMSKGLVKGRINQVKQTVSFTYVVPRVLTLDKIVIINKKFGSWKNSLNGFLKEIEDVKSTFN